MAAKQWEAVKEKMPRASQIPLRYIRVVYCDLSGCIRSKSVHVASIHVMDNGIACTAAMNTLPVYGDVIIPETGITAVGDIRLVPDWSRAFEIPHSPGNIHVFGDFILKGAPYSTCARGFLKRMLGEAAKLGLNIRSGFEEEFVVLRQDTVPIDNTSYGEVRSMNVSQQFIHELTEGILMQGIIPEMYHAESAPGQQEISLQYTDALAQADNHLIFRETAHATAQRQNLLVTFLPKLSEDTAGNGLHVHMSMWKGNENVFASEVGDQFMAGILQHLPALVAVTAASINSYDRLKAGTWASGAYQCWGLDNRDCAIRVPTLPDGSRTNFEFKPCDHTCNPHLALGVLIAAGLDGIKNKSALAPGVAVHPSTLAGQVNLLPASLPAALEQFEASNLMKEAMGPALFTAYLELKKAECKFFSEKTSMEVIKMLLQKY